MSAENKAAVRIALAGQSLIRHDPLPGAGADTSALIDLLHGCDAAFTNFEGSIAGRFGGWPMKDKAAHGIAPALLDVLTQFGFTHLSLANNHAGDLGPNGILSTLEETQARGFTVAGTGPTLTAATQAGLGTGIALVAMDAGPWDASVYASDGVEGGPGRPGVNRLKVSRRLGLPPEVLAQFATLAAQMGDSQRLKTRVAVGFQSPTPPGCQSFFGLTLEAAEAPEERWTVDETDLARQEAAIAAAKASGALVIASLHTHHWPADWERPAPWIPGLARRLLAAGADLFVGHGAPVLHGMDLIDGKPAFYGLGNFLFHSQRQSVRPHPSLWRSILAVPSFAGGRLNGVDVHALRLGGGDQPRLDDRPALWRGPEADAFLRNWCDQTHIAGWDGGDGRLSLRLDR